MKGVFYNKRTNRFEVRISVGSFRTEKEADARAEEVISLINTHSSKKVRTEEHTYIYFNKECNRWAVRIPVKKGKKLYLGVYASFEEARTAYVAFKKGDEYAWTDPLNYS